MQSAKWDRLGRLASPEGMQDQQCRSANEETVGNIEVRPDERAVFQQDPIANTAHAPKSEAIVEISPDATQDETDGQRANAIRHGCERDPDKKVQVCVACDDSRGMLIVVRDPGPGFNVESIPNPVEGENLFSQGGRGIFLINELMDDVSYEKGGTEIRMRKR